MNDAVFDILKTTTLAIAHFKYLWEWWYVRSVDNFLAYLVDQLELVFVVRPAILKSNNEIPMEDVLCHATMEDFIQYAARRRANKLMRDGFRKILEFFGRRLGIELFSDEHDLAHAERTVEARHLFVHRRGIIDNQFLQRVPNCGLPIGCRLKLSSDELSHSIGLLSLVVPAIDSALVKKFSLPTPHARETLVTEVARRIHDDSEASNCMPNADSE